MFPVTVRERVLAGEDAEGNPWYEWVSRPWSVRAIAPGAMREPSEPNRDLSIIAYTLYGSATGAPTSDTAQVVLDGVTYSVDGTPADWTRGPHPASSAGVVVELKRVEG